jgi:hypothetical protein
VPENDEDGFDALLGAVEEHVEEVKADVNAMLEDEDWDLEAAAEDEPA